MLRIYEIQLFCMLFRKGTWYYVNLCVLWLFFSTGFSLLQLGWPLNALYLLPLFYILVEPCALYVPFKLLFSKYTPEMTDFVNSRDIIVNLQLTALLIIVFFRHNQC